MSSTRGSLRRSGREKKLSVSEYSAGDLVAVRSPFHRNFQLLWWWCWVRSCLLLVRKMRCIQCSVAVMVARLFH